MEPRWVVVAVAVLLLAAVGPAFGGGQSSDPGPEDVRLVDLEGDSRLWPYTSRHTEFASRTLAINLVVYDDPEMVRNRLERRSNVTWQEVNESEETANFSVSLGEPRVGFEWSSAHGALRYTYVEREETGRWLPQRYQLHTGTYLGTRMHVRAYAPGGDSEWTALQAHGEYWDWFRLRHTVTDVWGTGRHLEEDFADQPLVSDVERAYATERGPTSEGISVVHVAAVMLLVAVPAVRRRATSVAEDLGASVADRWTLGLFGVALGVPVAVRGAGIALERALPWLAPKLIAAPLFVVLVAGLPVAVYRLGEGVPAVRGFALAAVGFLLGLTLEYAAIGVGGIPERYALHRLLLAVGLGAIAAGSRERGPPLHLLVAGFTLWAGAVLASVFGLV